MRHDDDWDLGGGESSHRKNERAIAANTETALRALAKTPPPLSGHEQCLATARRVLAPVEINGEPTPKQFRNVANICFEPPDPQILFWDRIVSAFQFKSLKNVAEPEYKRFADCATKCADQIESEAQELLSGTRQKPFRLGGKGDSIPPVAIIRECVAVVRRHLELDQAEFQKVTQRILPAILKPRTIFDDYTDGAICPELAKRERASQLNELILKARMPEYLAKLSQLPMPTPKEFRSISHPLTAHEWNLIVDGEDFDQGKLRPHYEKAIQCAEAHAAALELEALELRNGKRLTPSLLAGNRTGYPSIETIRKCAAVLREHLAADADDFRKLTRPIVAAVLKPAMIHGNPHINTDNYSKLPLTKV